MPQLPDLVAETLAGYESQLRAAKSLAGAARQRLSDLEAKERALLARLSHLQGVIGTKEEVKKLANDLVAAIDKFLGEKK